MEIRDNFSEKKIDLIAKQIYNYIQKEKELSKKNLEEITKLLKNKSFYVGLDNDCHVRGFIAKEELTNNFYELKSWFIIPKLRRSGLADKLFLSAIKNKEHQYLANTFQKKIVRRLQEFGFKKIKIYKLPIMIIFKYIITRKISSIFKHFFLKKSSILIKK